MQAAVLRALEFDRIREALASRTLTPLGRGRVEELAPATEIGAVRDALALTSEAFVFVREGGSLAIFAPDDLATTISVIGIEDHPLEPLALIGLARFLEAVSSAAGGARRSGGSRLSSIGERAVAFDTETAAVHRAIESTGDVSDRASSALKEIRDALRRQRARLRSSLDALARGRDTAKYLQDQIVTDRNGRYVLVVRAEHRDAIPGIVHGSSASGASLYLEPLATVQLNNDVVALVERERAEIHRVLSELTNAFRRRGEELEMTLDVAAELDELHAKVDLARRADGIAPELTDDNRLEFRGARHPLLIPAMRDVVESPRTDSVTQGAGPARQPVASDLLILPPARALVISGPNTGGKTVALKAFGLLALMAQAGLLIPVDPGSRFTPFRSVFADIGDEQSIAASLSTFSAHVANVVAMERALVLPALVLLDEVGGGTDPTEGGALGAAIVDHFHKRGALVVATTHDDTLKSYGSTTEGVTTAGFGFNPETYAPTYRIQYGFPGRSLALEIAERLGLPMDVIADARTRRTGRESLLAAHLARMDQELAGVAHQRDELALERASLAGERRTLLDREARLAEREAVLRRRLDERMNEKLREARAEVDRIVGTLKQKAEGLADLAERRALVQNGPLTTGEVGTLRAEAKAALGAVGAAVTSAPQSAAPEGLREAPVPGQTVFLRSFNAEGIVRAVSGKHVDVEVRGKRMRAQLNELALSGGRDTAVDRTPSRVRIDTAPRDTMACRDLVVVGLTVDEAIQRAEKFLDDALLADEHRLRVVHGHGTGRLREALTKFFREHPLVSVVAAASDKEGGGGATIVELKE
ncbi:MAG: Smr/MutS family protein [Vicinamibacterales bacterium]